MKKVSALLLVALVGSAISFTSCNKKGDWNCKCTIANVESTTVITNQKRNDAKDACDGIQGTARTSGFTADCSLSEK
jgi:hypothetical protein